MGTKQSEEQLEALRQHLMAAGVKILSGSWGGKGGIARYKGQWLLVVDRHLPTTLKLRLFQAMVRCLNGQEKGANSAPAPPEESSSTS